MLKESDLKQIKTIVTIALVENNKNLVTKDDLLINKQDLIKKISKIIAQKIEDLQLKVLTALQEAVSLKFTEIERELETKVGRTEIFDWCDRRFHKL